MSDLHWSPSGRPRPYIPTAPRDDKPEPLMTGTAWLAVFVIALFAAAVAWAITGLVT